MPRQVLRWDVPIDDQAHNVGGGPVVMVASRRSGIVELWTDESEDSVDLSRLVQVYGTGHLIPQNATHLSSTFDAMGPHLVWHLFQVGGAKQARACSCGPNEACSDCPR